LDSKVLHSTYSLLFPVTDELIAGTTFLYWVFRVRLPGEWKLSSPVNSVSYESSLDLVTFEARLLLLIELRVGQTDS